MRFSNAGAFVDDSWRITNRLTLNLGLRYELGTPPYEVHDRWVNLNMNSGLAVLPNDPGQGRSLRNLDSNNLGPRIGIAYTVCPPRFCAAASVAASVEGYNVGNQMYKNLPFFFRRFTHMTPPARRD